MNGFSTDTPLASFSPACILFIVPARRPHFFHRFMLVTNCSQEIMDCLQNYKKFPVNIPLPTMVEFLEMVWEEDGV
jgi:hypothetical protein